MAFRFSKDLKVILHPYLFVLKEGQEINKDFLDYSLLMLQVSCPETIRSPKNQSKKKLGEISEFDLLRPNFPPDIFKKTPV